eukprot:m.260219 g.260219  ORF g.260219 m.260219 type:complete len:124 (+) comp16212_c0_seq45:343-714(+)
MDITLVFHATSSGNMLSPENAQKMRQMEAEILVFAEERATYRSLNKLDTISWSLYKEDDWDNVNPDQLSEVYISASVDDLKAAVGDEAFHTIGRNANGEPMIKTEAACVEEGSDSCWKVVCMQ